MLLETNGKGLLIDCGSQIPFMLKEAGKSVTDIDAVYISHMHDDHAGGLEWLGFASYFTDGAIRPNLYAHENILKQLWTYNLKASMRTMTEETQSMSAYFVARYADKSFEFEDIKLDTVPVVHVVNNHSGHMYSYGLMIHGPEKKAFLTTDMTYAELPVSKEEWDISKHWDLMQEADVIFHDCETINTSEVHPHYDFLKTFPESIKKKMWLYHYQASHMPDAKADGFQGLVTKGQKFHL